MPNCSPVLLVPPGAALLAPEVCTLEAGNGCLPSPRAGGGQVPAGQLAWRIVLSRQVTGSLLHKNLTICTKKNVRNYRYLFIPSSMSGSIFHPKK